MHPIIKNTVLAAKGGFITQDEFKQGSAFQERMDMYDRHMARHQPGRLTAEKNEAVAAYMSDPNDRSLAAIESVYIELAAFGNQTRNGGVNEHLIRARDAFLLGPVLDWARPIWERLVERVKAESERTIKEEI